MTRMRFVLVEPSKADTEKIEAIPAVKGTFTQAGQFQVIIGNDVAIFYNEFTAYAGIEGVGKDVVKAAAKSNQSLAQRIVGTDVYKRQTQTKMKRGQDAAAPGT